jgi:signal recognition particle receptor subunit alpha
LTPSHTIDILRDAQVAKSEGRPYSIVFVGVNGVGKSTSLAKVCAWLLQNGLSTMIIACDTFRAGAVEQLKVHANALNVQVYDQGYASDPTNVAKFGIKKGMRAARRALLWLIDTVLTHW